MSAPDSGLITEHGCLRCGGTRWAVEATVCWFAWCRGEMAPVDNPYPQTTG